MAKQTALFALLAMASVTNSSAQFGTTLLISETLSSSIAADAFPVHFRLNTGKLRLSEPRVSFLDTQRISLSARLQAYDHRPEEGIVVSEKGHLSVSGRLGYDKATREILLHDPKIDRLTFDTESALTNSIRADVKSTWAAHADNPIRTEVPQHTYTMAFRNNLEAISYDGINIGLTVLF